MTSHPCGKPNPPSYLLIFLKNYSCRIPCFSVRWHPRQMPYEHDIFISYKRSVMWTPWVLEEFKPRLEGFLESEVGPSLVFADDNIQAGAHWEEVLHSKICRSKIMIALLSASYFKSPWCKKELALMLEREQICAHLMNQSNHGLIIPIRLGGEGFPKRIADIQRLDFARHANPDISKQTLPAYNFSNDIQSLAKIISDSLFQAPSWESSWDSLDGSTVISSLEPIPRSVEPSRIITQVWQKTKL